MMRKFRFNPRKVVLLLLCLLILQEFLPMTETEASGLQLWQIGDVTGEDLKTYALRSNGDLVTWPRGPLTGSGELLPFSPWFYLFRRTAARHVISFSGWSRAFVYVDQDHVLWEKRDGQERVRLMEDVRKAEAWSNCTFALKTDGSLWSWGNNAFGGLGLGWEDSQVYPPQKILDNIASISLVGDTPFVTPFAITKDGTLLYWGANTDGAPEPAAENVTAVSELQGYLYQYLTPQGEVYTLPVFFKDAAPERIAEDAYAIFDGGVIKNDRTQWLWDGGEDIVKDGGELVQVREGVQTAADRNFYADTYGRLHWVPYDWTLPAPPRSVRSLNATLRNLFLLALAYHIWRERRQNNACRERKVIVEDLDWM